MSGTAEQGINIRSKNIRKMLTPSEKNVLHKTLIDPKEILLPLLHIKLDLMKQFVKDGDCFKYLCKKCPHLSEIKLKGFFVGLIFEAMNSTKENEAWVLFKEIVTKFLGNIKASNNEPNVANLIDKFKTLGCLMS